MLISDVFVENHFENSNVIGLSYGEIVRFTLKNQYNVTKCNKKGPFSVVIYKAAGLKMHFIGFQTTYYHADTS